MYRIHVETASGWVITERVRPLPARRFRRHAPELALDAAGPAEIRRVFARLLTT